eukprot:jgi/Botrbrau1/11673/Bobra.0195s0004.1
MTGPSFPPISAPQQSVPSGCIPHLHVLGTSAGSFAPVLPPIQLSLPPAIPIASAPFVAPFHAPHWFPPTTWSMDQMLDYLMVQQGLPPRQPLPPIPCGPSPPPLSPIRAASQTSAPSRVPSATGSVQPHARSPPSLVHLTFPPAPPGPPPVCRPSRGRGRGGRSGRAPGPLRQRQPRLNPPLALSHPIPASDGTPPPPDAPSPTATTPPAARARGCRTQILHHGPSFCVQYFSLTITSRHNAIPTAWLPLLQTWAQSCTEKALFALEFGEKNNHPHIQGTFAAPWNPSPAGLDALRKSLRSACGMQTGEGVVINVKVFETTQTFPKMLGYCMKDRGKPHFQYTQHNVSPAELEEGIASYSLVRDFFSGRQEINRQNLYRFCHNFHRHNLHPLPAKEVSLDCVLRFMLLSREYYPSPNWIISGTGRGLSYQRAQSLWELLCDPDADIPLDVVQDIFFENPRGGIKSLQTKDPHGFCTMPLREAQDLARDARDDIGNIPIFLANLVNRRIAETADRERQARTATDPETNPSPTPDLRSPSPTESEKERAFCSLEARAERRARWAALTAAAQSRPSLEPHTSRPLHLSPTPVQFPLPRGHHRFQPRRPRAHSRSPEPSPSQPRSSLPHVYPTVHFPAAPPRRVRRPRSASAGSEIRPTPYSPLPVRPHRSHLDDLQDCAPVSSYPGAIQV